MILEMGIMGSHIIWRIRFRALRKEAEAAGVSVDKMLERRQQGSMQTDDAYKREQNTSEGVPTPPCGFQAA